MRPYFTRNTAGCIAIKKRAATGKCFAIIYNPCQDVQPGQHQKRIKNIQLIPQTFIQIMSLDQTETFVTRHETTQWLSASYSKYLV